MRRLRILVVDDDPDFAEGLSLSLEIAGHEVESAAGGEEAIGKFQAVDFDITFMDFRLPGMSGVELFGVLRKIKPYAKVVMMTAFGVEDQLRKAVDQGAHGVMRKPFTGDELLQTVDRLRPAGIVLLADDDPDFAESIEMSLANADYSVMIVQTGPDALDALQTGRFDVLVLDVRLPVLGGGEVYRQMHEERRTIPTIVVTAYAEEESDTLETLRSMSIAKVLTKPFETAKLLRAVDVIMADSAIGGL